MALQGLELKSPATDQVALTDILNEASMF